MNTGGHFNTQTDDQDSIVTHHGEHFRVLATLPDHEGLYCRVDHCHGKRIPTVDEILDVARKDQGVHGKWTLAKSTEYESNGLTRTDFQFTPVARSERAIRSQV
jgi:hypothetical protein